MIKITDFENGIRDITDNLNDVDCIVKGRYYIDDMLVEALRVNIKLNLLVPETCIICAVLFHDIARGMGPPFGPVQSNAMFLRHANTYPISELTEEYRNYISNAILNSSLDCKVPEQDMSTLDKLLRLVMLGDMNVKGKVFIEYVLLRTDNTPLDKHDAMELAMKHTYDKYGNHRPGVMWKRVYGEYPYPRLRRLMGDNHNYSDDNFERRYQSILTMRNR